MVQLSRSDFARLSRKLSTQELRLFVADILKAQGWETSIEEDQIIATRQESTEQRIVSVRNSGLLGLFGPRIVYSEGALDNSEPIHDPEKNNHLDPENLYEMLVYSIDSSTADKICRKHIGRPIHSGDQPSPRFSWVFGNIRSDRFVKAVVSVIVFLILLGVFFTYFAAIESKTSSDQLSDIEITPIPNQNINTTTKFTPNINEYNRNNEFTSSITSTPTPSAQTARSQTIYKIIKSRFSGNGNESCPVDENLPAGSEDRPDPWEQRCYSR